ncbi:MAG: methenyltetrahydromethanopterin cyclohydrolase, partial [Gemmataceae bacterium]
HTLNEYAAQMATGMEARAESLQIAIHIIAGAHVIDCGISVPGGIQAGLALARICMAGRGEVTLVPSMIPDLHLPALQVTSDDPIHACMASQYAGWQISVGKYFAMGSGPMRAAYGQEALFDHLPGREKSPVAVGILETKKLPTKEVISYLCEKLAVTPDRLILLCAPASSLAGTIQVVARSLETALHKLHELGFDLKKIVSGYGIAPIPPVSNDEIAAIGRTNDAILYGGEVHLWIQAEDSELLDIGPKVPSMSSRDHGKPFAKIFSYYGNDFYKVDPHLFSPAVVTFCNLKTGRRLVFGKIDKAVLRQSFGEN